MVTYQGYGHNAVELTNWSTSAASVIAAGSVVEVAAALFAYSGNDTNDATSFSAIATNATAYLQLVPSGTVGSQIVTSSWTSTAPVYRDDLHGWYASAASSTRYVGGCVKTGATSYELKFIITPRSNIRHEQAESFTNLTTTTMTVTDTASVAGVLTASGGISENSVTIKRKIVDIGDWDMDTNAQKNIAHGLDYTKIRNVFILIRDDANINIRPLDWGGNTGVLSGLPNGNWRLDAFGDVIATRGGTGLFDSTDYNATSYNRGWVSIDYEA